MTSQAKMRYISLTNEEYRQVNNYIKQIRSGIPDHPEPNEPIPGSMADLLSRLDIHDTLGLYNADKAALDAKILENHDQLSVDEYCRFRQLQLLNLISLELSAIASNLYQRHQEE